MIGRGLLSSLGVASLGVASLAVGSLAALVACGGEGARPAEPAPIASPARSVPSAAPAAPVGKRFLTIVGTNDLHGRMSALPLLAGYVDNVRENRRHLGGSAVLVVDAGDMFQGTLESNLAEGMGVVKAYAAIGYDAVAIGNHELDFGPVGPRATPGDASDDPRGALKALAAAAPFPFLGANLSEKGGEPPPAWQNVKRSVVVEREGLRVGVVGLLTEETLRTTISANVKDLAIASLAETLTREAKRLRQVEHVHAVVAVMHAGGKCARFQQPVDASHCDMESEAFRLARALPKGLVDAIFGGHTHAGLANEVEGIPIVEGFAYGTAFSRVDLTLEGDPPRVTARAADAPHALCPKEPRTPRWATCELEDYDGRPVVRSAKVADVIAPYLAAAAAKKAELLGVVLEGPIPQAYATESALGNLLADLLREGRADVDVALMNGGGLRADLPAGPLTYASLFEAFPFDNRIATAKVTVRDLKALVAQNLSREGGILSVSGVDVAARCNAGKLDVELRRKGRALRDADVLNVLASDFMMTGGDAFWGDVKPPPIAMEDTFMRDVFEAGLRKRKSLVASSVYDAKKPRMAAPARPVRCR